MGDALVITDPERPTGIMFKGRVSRGDPPIFYRRRGSAAAALSREDVERLDLSAFGCLHLTGILPALSPCALDAAEYLVDKARAAGLFISFDPNLRPQLWPSPAVMAETVNRLAARADLFLPGAGEGERLMGSADPAAIARHYQRLGVRYVVVKTGKTGAYAAGEGEAFQSPTYQETAVVDTVGAGDGFAAGVLSALREGGLPAVEITFRTPAAADAIREACAAAPEAFVCAGTVLTAQQAEQAVAAGAKAIVSPGTNMEVVDWCLAQGVPVIPGCATPSEIEACMRKGLRLVKLFPAEVLGGVRMLKALAGPYAGVSFMATGGISPANVGDYLRQKNIVCCGGSWIVPEAALDAGDFDAIRRLAAEARAIVDSI